MKLFVRGGNHQRPQHIGTNFNFGTRTSVTVNLPSGTPGDLLVAFAAVAVPAADTGTITQTGYTSVRSRLSLSAKGVMYQVSERIADGSEAGTLTMTSTQALGAGSAMYGEVKRYRPGRGLNASLFTGQAGDQSSSAATAPTIPALSPAQPSGVLQGWWINSAGSVINGSDLGAPPAGFVTRVRSQGSTGAGTPTYMALVSADKDWPSGTPGAQALDLPVGAGGNEWLGVSLFIV